MTTSQNDSPTTAHHTKRQRPVKARPHRKCRVCGIDMEAEGWRGTLCPDCAYDQAHEAPTDGDLPW